MNGPIITSNHKHHTSLTSFPPSVLALDYVFWMIHKETPVWHLSCASDKTSENSKHNFLLSFKYSNSTWCLAKVLLLNFKDAVISKNHVISCHCKISDDISSFLGHQPFAIMEEAPSSFVVYELLYYCSLRFSEILLQVFLNHNFHPLDLSLHSVVLEDQDE